MDHQLDESLILDDESMATSFEVSDANVVSHDDLHEKMEHLSSSIELQNVDGEELLIERESEEIMDELPDMASPDFTEEEVLMESHSPDEESTKIDILPLQDALPSLETPTDVPPLIPVNPRLTQSVSSVNSLINTQVSRSSPAIKPLAIAPKPVTLITKQLSLPAKKTFTTLQSQRDGTIVGLDSSGRQVLFQMANVSQNKANGVPTTAVVNSGSNGSQKLKLVTQTPQQFFVLADGNTSKLPFHAKPSFITKKPSTFAASSVQSTPHFTTTKKIVQAKGINQIHIPKGSIQAVNSSGGVTTPKYLTFQQAQQLGLLTNSSNLKLQQVLNVQKPVQNVQVIRPQTTAKSPTKILPAPVHGGKLVLPSGNQTVVIRPSITNSAQLVKTNFSNIKLGTSQNVNFGNASTAVISGNTLNARQLQSIHVPGKYVRLVPANATSSANTANMPTISKFKPSPIAPKPASDATISLPPNATGQRTLLSVSGGKTLLLPDGLSSFLKIPSSKGHNTLIATNQPPTIKKIVTKPQQKLIPVTLSFASSLQKISTATSLLNTTSLSAANIQTPGKTAKCQETMATSVPSSKENTSKSEDSKLLFRSLVGSTEETDENDVELDHEETYMDDSEQEEGDTSGDTVDHTDSTSAVKNSSDKPSTQHVLMLPASFLQQINNQENLKNLASSGDIEIKEELLSRMDFPPGAKSIPVLDHSLELGMRPRKPCNCTKSQCLKLYCDCFANGEFCHQCNCGNCFNNLEYEEERQKAIKNCLDRNPNAFRPKIGKAKSMIGQEAVIRRHNKGCNCKRSGCLKNYCECYEAKIACSANCKCVGCRNVEDSVERSRMSTAILIRNSSGLSGARGGGDDESAVKLGPASRGRTNSLNTSFVATALGPPPHTKQPCSFMTSDVIDAVCQCLLAAAGEGGADGQNESSCPVSADPIRRVLEEYARCLQDIIGAALHAQPPGETAA